MQVLRLLVVTVITGGLSWFLGAIILRGLKTGSIRHTDSTQYYERKQNPLGFWSVVVLCSVCIIVFVTVWIWVAKDVIAQS